MKKYLSELATYALFAITALAMACAPAAAQSVISLPTYIDNSGGAKDFGNGPLEFKILQGSAIITTSQGFGTVSSVSGTLITLTATPTTPPCINNNNVATQTALNCAVGGGGITPGTLIGSYNASTGTGTGTGPSIGISTLNTTNGIFAGMQIGWGGACPATPPGGSPVQAQQPGPGDLPFYTYARLCGYAQFSPGATVLPFAIGAH